MALPGAFGVRGGTGVPEGLNVVLVMKTSIRIKLGIVLAVLAVVAVAALAWSGVPLLSRTTNVLGSSPDATVTDEAIRLHWSLIPPGLAFVIGMLLVFIPCRKDAATKQP